MNGTPDDAGNLKSFYGYKETFKKGTQWVKIPQHLTFVHTKNPYEDGDGFEREGELPLGGSMDNSRLVTGHAYGAGSLPKDGEADMTSASATYDNINERLMAGLASAAESAVAENASTVGDAKRPKYSEFEPAPTSYPQYATRGLEALSAVASQGQYNGAEIPPPLHSSTAGAPSSRSLPTSTSPQQGIAASSKQTSAHKSNLSVDVSPATDGNIDPRLQCVPPTAPNFQLSSTYVDQS
nr:hypothetical protein CFP56_64020 [Quercus suber]